jgi:hypothetical protein
MKEQQLLRAQPSEVCQCAWLDHQAPCRPRDWIQSPAFRRKRFLGAINQQLELDTPKTAAHEQIGERTVGFSLPCANVGETIHTWKSFKKVVAPDFDVAFDKSTPTQDKV